MMDAYLCVFVNWDQNNWARLLPIAEFVYNNSKNTSIGHMPFELNCDYYSRMSYEEEVDPRSQSKLVDKLSEELKELMTVCCKILHHAQELQKRAHNKGVKPQSYVSGKKVWLNSKFIKIKQNHKLEAKFFRSFRMLYPIGKQVYKLEFSRNWRIYDIFYVSLLEQDTTKKGREFSVPEFKPSNDKEYKMEAIRDSAVYSKEIDRHLLELYNLVAWKGYQEEENTWKPSLAVIYLRKIINIFHRDYLEKPTVTSAFLDSVPPMAKPTIHLSPKQMWRQVIRRTKKWTQTC